MKIGFVFIDGLDVLTFVKDLRHTFAEIIKNEIDNENFKKDRYYLTVTFSKILNGTWGIEWYKNQSDPENSKRFRLSWYYALDDEKAKEKYTEGKASSKFVAEYFVTYVNEEEKKEDNEQQVESEPVEIKEKK